jgi:hypothetical protein
MTMFDVRYLYLFSNTYSIYIKGILKGSLPIPLKKTISIQKTHQNIFVSIYLFLKNLHNKKTQISNSYLTPLTNLAFLIWKKN